MKESVFKSPERRDKMRAHYNGILTKFPFEQRYVDTSYGRTFMLIAGKETDPAIILLHGSNANSAFCLAELTALSSRYRVYAVDIIGEAGNSEEYRPDLNTNDFADWLKEVLNALGIENSIVIGNSLGGWVALKFAAAYPEFVSMLILVAPAGIAPIRQKFLQDVQNARQDDGIAPITSDILGGREIPKEVLAFMNLIAQSYNPIQELPLFSDAQLQVLNMPVFFIDGEDDVIIDAKESAQRLSRLIPSAKIQLMPKCGHAITNAIEYILPFLNDNK
jgi:pimeloyl-ACP methyl ester carboxylesterase